MKLRAQPRACHRLHRIARRAQRDDLRGHEDHREQPDHERHHHELATAGFDVAVVHHAELLPATVTARHGLSQPIGPLRNDLYVCTKAGARA